MIILNSGKHIHSLTNEKELSRLTITELLRLCTQKVRRKKSFKEHLIEYIILVNEKK